MSMPAKLYHYTTANALINILESRELWLTEHRFLNDPEEFIFYKTIIKNACINIDVEEWLTKLNGQPNLQQRLRGEWTRFTNGLFRPSFEPPLGYCIYVFSLSEDGDSLAQWRAYGNGEVCIEFRSDQLLKLERSSPNSSKEMLRRVTYRPPDFQDDDMIAEIKHRLDEAVDFGIHSGHIPQIFINRSDQYEALFIKHDGFKAEQEWRMTMSRTTLSFNPNITVRAVGRYMVPFERVKFQPAEAITAIIFGPGSDPQLVAHFKSLFDNSFFFAWAAGAGRSCQIRRSSIPYRT